MSVNSEIERLQNAKSALKTSIEGKGVSVPAATKLDGYSALVDSIETGGGSAPYIVNPLNGASFGSETLANSSITHQYQVSSGNIVQCSISCMGEYPTFYPNGSLSETFATFPITMLLKDTSSLHASAGYLSITPTGLLSITSQRSSSAVNNYPWILVYRFVVVMLKLDSGVWLIDTFMPYIDYTCFIKGTKISLANGKKINVEDIDYDTELLVWNFDEGKYDSAKPLWIKKTETTTWYYKLKFSNGLELKVTGTYPEAHSLFSVEDGKFIHANKLVGKKVYTLDGIATLESCEEVHENVEFYNIITNYHMNLFAENVLTSTSLNNLYPIKDMKFVKEDREPVFDYTQFSDDWILGARLKEQPTDVTKYCLDHIKLTK